jgi:hypothetical protein
MKSSKPWRKQTLEELSCIARLKRFPVLAVFILSSAMLHGEMLCGVDMGNSMAPTIKYIEAYLNGRPIECQLLQDVTNGPESGLAGNSTIKGGVAYIKIDMMSRPQERRRLIAHELFHLKLIASGAFSPEKTKSDINPRCIPGNQNGMNRITTIAQELNSEVQHRIFFPEMRKLGFDPNEEFNNTFNNYLAKGIITPALKGLPEEAALYYMRVLDTEPSFAPKVSSGLVHLGFKKQVKLGEELHSLIIKTSPRNQEESNAFVGHAVDLIYCETANWQASVN